ncbi:hypothetical protein ACH42_00475 [Endozoicomonas sp. (ex Bugula neritina AB1)]|nr:hypothetical protein ACH42_00475 [Endozoicomonas sp. (ex Bugula neritina AB1)]
MSEHRLSNNANIRWSLANTPASKQFDDVYFSSLSGLAEARHVFIDRNQLPERFRSLQKGHTLTIGETGFGTGLNFLCAWQLFDDLAPEGSQLHFVSTEKYPLTPKDMQRALTAFPELQSFADKLCFHYRPPADGSFHIELAAGRVHLTLLIGDSLTTLPHLNTTVDTWFLDGFAPAKNPEMWQPALFRTMALKSTPKATYATFTAAALVRRGLSDAGFSVKKCPGFANKRDMLCGELMSAQQNKANPHPWFTPSSHNNPDQAAIVIGGGLAGTSCAHSLAERGWQVEIIEQHKTLAAEASGNPQGVLYAKLSPDNTPLSRFIQKGYQYTLELLDRLEIDEWQQCGVIQLSTHDKVAERHQKLDQQHPDSLLQYLTHEQLSEIAGLPVKHSGLYFPQAGWVSPPALCAALANHPNIHISTETRITEISKENDKWQLYQEGKQVAQTRTLIVAEGTTSHQLDQLQYLPLKAIRGQITQTAATEASKHLSSCVCGEGYIAPAMDGSHTMGATFHFKDIHTAITEKDHQINLGMQSHWFPAMYQAMGGENAKILGGRVGFRCTTPDYLPVVGAIVDYPQFIEQYAPLRKNMKHRFSDSVHYLEGLYVSSGHGSRGTISCPLSGEILACMITGEDSPLDKDLQHNINPTRFLVRALARNKI